MSDLLKMFNPDNVLSILLFLVVIGAGVFAERHWKEILEFFEKRHERTLKLKEAEVEADQGMQRNIRDLTVAVVRLEAQVISLVSAINHLYDLHGNGVDVGKKAE